MAQSETEVVDEARSNAFEGESREDVDDERLPPPIQKEVTMQPSTKAIKWDSQGFENSNLLDDRL